jgi:predicted transcriptional regulator
MKNISKRAKQVLKILADEYEKNPESRQKGIPAQVLGARIGALGNDVLVEIEELIDNGYVSSLGRRRPKSSILITERGYRYVRPPPPAVIAWLAKYQTPIKAIAVVIGTIATTITVILRLMDII